MSVDRGRVRATWKLAESCLDHLPQARQPSSTLGALPGLAASREVPCPACGARGRVFEAGKPCVSCPPRVGPNAEPPAFGKRHGCHPCPACEGTGWRRRRTTDAAIDSYAGVEVPKADEADDVSVGAIRRALQAERERPEIREGALRRASRLINQAERPESIKYAWEEAWDRMCQSGSYAEFFRALEVLRMNHESAYSIIWQVVCQAQPIRLSESRQGFLNEAMVELAALMPERIRVPYWLRDDRRNELRKDSLWRGRSPAHSRERRERDAEIVRLRVEEGWKTERLCKFFALSRAQVKKVIAAAAADVKEPVT